MANTYTKAAFTILMSHADAMLLRVAEQACGILDTGGEDEDLARQYDALDPAFRAVFPPEGASKFGTFLAIFPDPGFPCNSTERRMPASRKLRHSSTHCESAPM